MNSSSSLHFARVFAHSLILAGLALHQILLRPFIDVNLLVGGYSLCALVFLCDALFLFFRKALASAFLSFWLLDALFLAGLVLIAGAPALALVFFLALLLAAPLFLEGRQTEALRFLTAILIFLPPAFLWREGGTADMRLYLSVFSYSILGAVFLFGLLFLRKTKQQAQKSLERAQGEDQEPSPHIGLSLDLSRKLKPALNALRKYFPSDLDQHTGRAEKVTEKKAPPDPSTASRGARDLNKIRSFILNFIKYAEPEESPERDFLDLQPLLMFLLKELKNHPQRPENLIQHTDWSGNLTVKGSAFQLKQCFQHILINSFEALKNQSLPKIHIRGKAEKRFVSLEFEDNGHGIAPDETKKIFAPFFSKRFGLRGLGLPYVQKIVTAHGGRISVQKSRPEGALITVRFPLALHLGAKPPPGPLKARKTKTASAA